jgi:HTH-type transcriptional regulator / antitoxin HigA
VNGLLERPTLTPDVEDYLNVLGLLIADYEDSIYEHPELTPVDRLRFLMDEHALTQAELARRTGVPVTSLSDILNLKRVLDSSFLNFDVSPFAMARGSSPTAFPGATFHSNMALK